MARHTQGDKGVDFCWVYVGAVEMQIFSDFVCCVGI